MIELAGVEFRYPLGDFLLRLPPIRIERGERVAVIGPSGCGKSTLLKLIAGILLPLRGRVSVGETSITALDDAGRRAHRMRHIGFVFQEFELIEYLDVLDNIVHPYRIGAGLRLDAQVRARAVSLAQAMGIGARLRHRPAELSHGERQRTAICRALITRPTLLLADEPTGNLDPATGERIIDLLAAASDEEGVTLVTVTHDRDLVGRFGRVIDLGAA
jgi:ABC-type lipoprotein export system ATPase subunit